MALQRPNNRKLLSKDEEEEKKKQKQSEDYFVLPTFEEMQEIERTAKEDAAMTVSSGMRRTLPADIGRTSANAARQELSDRIDPLMEQKRKVEEAQAEFERMRFAPYSQFAPGLPSAKSVAREKMLEEENKYDRMRMTDAEYERTHKADLGETAEILANSYVAGVAKAGGMAADIAKATGAGIKKAIAGFTDPEAYETSSLYKEFRKGYQQELANGESYYDEFDRYYREMRKEQDEKFGKLNTFTNYVEQAAHSGGEMAPIMLLASMGNAMFSGTKLLTSIGAKAQSMMASGNKATKLLGKVLSGVTPGNIASGAGLYVTSSASGTKEAVTEMQNINAQYEAVGLPPKYTDEEIEERAALYGFLTGITEAGGEHAIGGLYGTSTGGITKSIKNPLIKAAASWLIGGIGEGVEESLQTLASYGLKNAVYDAGVSVSWREVLDSGIVGFIMGETTAFPTAVSNTQLGIEAQNAIADALKTAGKARNDAEAGVAAVNASAQAKAYAGMAEEVRKSGSDNAQTVAEIYDWMAERMQQISDAMTDDKKRAEIVARNSGTLDEMNRIAERYGIADGIADTKRAMPEDVARMTQSIRDYEQKNGINITDRAGAGTETAQGARAYSMDASRRGELIDRTGRESGAAEGTISFAHDVSSVTGRGIRFYRQAAQNGYIENGYYDPDTDTVYINTASKNPAAQILAHELTHSVEGTDAYLSLRAMVFDLMRRDGVDIDAKYREKEMLYSEAGYRLRDEGEIAHEVIAEYVEQHLLTDEASIRDLAKENRTLGQRIREWLDFVLAKLGNASAKERDYVRRVRDMYTKALGEDVTMDGGKVNREFSVSEADDRRYMEAVESGDTDAAQRMVDKIAKKHGYSIKAYHGTPVKGITVFDEKKIGSTTDEGLFGRGFYFSTNKATADGYAGENGETMPVFLKIKNPWWGNGRKMQEVLEQLGIDKTTLTTRTIDKRTHVVAPLQNFSGVFASRLKDKGFDSVIVQHGKHDYEIVVFDNKNIKSADPVTYDDNGNVIPLSERFKRDNDDVRYSVSKTDDSAGNNDYDLNDLIAQIPDRNGQQTGETESDTRIADILGLSDDDLMDMIASRMRGEEVAEDAPVTQDAPVVTSAVETEVEPLEVGGDTVTDAEAEQTIQGLRNDIAADEARYRELTDIVMSDEEFMSLMPDEQNAVLDEMQEIRARIDETERIIEDMQQTEEAGENVPVPGDADVPRAASGRSSASSGDGYTVTVPKDFDNPRMTYDSAAVEANPDMYEYELQRKGRKSMEFSREDLTGRRDERKEKYAKRQTVAKAETAFRRLGYDVAGAIVDDYEEAPGIIEDDKFAAQVESDIKKYIEQNDVSPRVDTTAKLIAAGEMEATEKDTGLSGEQLEHAKELASLYEEFQTYKSNTIRAHGAWTTDIVNKRLDQILDGYDWFSDKGKKAKRLGNKLQLNLSNPEQVMRDAFGDAKTVRDADGNVERTVDPAEALNEYIIRPTIENSARARRQTNQQIAALRDLCLNKSESAMTQIFSEYSDLEESGSHKRVLTEDRLRAVLLGEVGAGEIAIDVTNMEYDAPSKEQEEFRDSVKEAIENEISVNRNRAKQRAYREFKEAGGSKAQWNALTKEARQAKIDEAFRAVTEESVGRIVEATKEMRSLLDDMYEAINAISVIHGAQPIPFRRGYMPHSHRQVAEVQKWFNDHMGGIDVTPVGELPTDIAGKTADRKPNKRWFAHAQQRTGPRTEWNALGNVEDYLRVANDTIYHIDDIRKIRVLERYIRGIYSVARGATGEDQRKLVRNDVMRRLHKELDDDELVFLGLKKHDKPMINDDDMDLSQMTPIVTWLTHYGNDLAAKQVYNRDTEDLVGRGINNFANKFTSWSNRTMMQYNISSNLKQLSQLGAVSGDVGIRISKDAGEAVLKSMRNLGNGSNDLEQRYHISERSTFLAEKTAVEKAAFASDKDLTEKQKSDRQLAKDIWDSAWSFTDLTMSRFAVYSYFMEGMERGMDETAALQYADTKARNILASRMKGSSPLIFQSKNPVLRMFTLFQREPLAAWQDVLKTMPREFEEMKNTQGEGAAKTWIAKRITGRVLGAAMVNTFYSAVLGLGTPAMFDILSAPLSALLEKVIGDLTEDEDDDQTWRETLKGFGANLKNEVADDLPFASLIAAIVNTATGADFESRLPINAPDAQKLRATITSPIEIKKLKKQIEEADDADTIEALTADRENLKSQIPFIYLTALLEIAGSAVPSGNQIKKSLGGLIATLRGGEYDTKGRLKYEVGGADAVRAVILGKSNTKAAQEWVESGFDSYTKDETEAYNDLIEIGVSPEKAARYVRAVSAAEKIDKTETQAQAEGRILDRIEGLDEAQKAEVYYDMIASDGQREGIDAAVQAGADMADAVETARAIRDASKKLQKLTALTASDMDTGAKEAIYLSMVATAEKDDEGNVIGTTDDDVIRAIKDVGLDFDDFLSAKKKQSSLNADESLSANQRASRFLAWVASEGYTEKQADIIGESFGFASGFRVKSETYQKIVDGGVTPDNAVKVSDALSGTKRSIDKINAIWSTGLTGEQLDRAIKAVLTESAYEKYRIVIDANVPLEAYTWVLDNADTNGNGSINAEERLAALQRLDLPLSELSALWLATGGSEKSNPYADSYDFDMDFSFDFDFGW